MYEVRITTTDLITGTHKSIHRTDLTEDQYRSLWNDFMDNPRFRGCSTSNLRGYESDNCPKWMSCTGILDGTCTIITWTQGSNNQSK